MTLLAHERCLISTGNIPRLDGSPPERFTVIEFEIVENEEVVDDLKARRVAASRNWCGLLDFQTR